MTDPRQGLQRRYDMEEILELHKGKPKIQGLSYNALRILKDPLYVKMGQELKDESQSLHQRIHSEKQRENDTRMFTSKNDIPHDHLNSFDDDDMGDDGMGPPPPDNRPQDSPQPPPQQPPSSQPSQSQQPPPPPQSQQTSQSSQQPPPPPPPAAASNPNSILFRSNMEIQAELAALKQELNRKNNSENVIREVRQNIVHNNPIKEIVKEFHQTIYPPQMIPTPVQQDNPRLIAALEQAMMRNTNLEKIASQMGISIEQMAHLLAQKNKKPEEMASTSSSSGQPPPPPPPPTRLQRSRSRSVIVEPPIDPVEIPVSRDTSNQPRAPSIASTTDYRSRSGPRKEPTPIPINTREPSMASTADYRSKSREVKPERSRSRNPENIVLPIKEESDEPRGRSMKTRNDKIIQQMLASQNKKIN